MPDRPADEARQDARRGLRAFIGGFVKVSRPSATDRIVALFYGGFGVALTTYSAIRLWWPGTVVGTILMIVFGTRAAGAEAVQTKADAQGLAANVDFGGEQAVAPAIGGSTTLESRTAEGPSVLLPEAEVSNDD